MIYKELKIMLKQYEIAIKALELIGDSKYTMRMIEARRALERIKRLEKRKNKRISDVHCVA